MARVILPEGQQRSGKQGGIVWSRNRYGPYTRDRAIPVNPNTDLQVAVRNAVRALTIAWADTLTAAQRNWWDTYAANVTWLDKMGRATFLTGLNHYVRCNTPLIVNGYTRVDAAPSIYDLAPAELSLAVTASQATQQLSVAFDDGLDWCDADGAYQFVYMGSPQNGSRKFFGGPWRLAGVIEGSSVAPPTSPVAFAAPFPFAEGNRIWVRTRIALDDGRLSQFAQDNFLAAA